MKTVNLILFSDSKETPEWSLGKVFPCSPQTEAINSILDENLQSESVDAWLFWDPDMGIPDHNMLMELLETSADCWHAGLALGLGGEPEMIDFISPTWMLNRDPDPSLEATSWRLSLRACLIRSDVLRQLGGPRSEFESLEAAGLELGLRYIRQGAFVRYVPGFVGEQKPISDAKISLNDQLLFVRYSFGSRWAGWAIFRAALTRFASLFSLIRSWQRVRKLPKSIYPASCQRDKTLAIQPVDGRVTVLIPTLRRYPYLQVLLDQLRWQTVAPFEIIVVDQTPLGERNLEMKYEFSDLPLRWFFLDQAGQCSSRNFGLQTARSEYILFLDDDDEIQPDLIERHLTNLSRYRINISNGVAIEPKAGDLPEEFRILRVSNVFPTNNTMIRRDLLQKSGLFDLAYDHGQRADHDLGMRLYLTGELMVLDPDISVIHHHAPVGGLREHKARVDTYAASRKRLLKQILPSVSDIYLSKRFFTEKQVREKCWIDILGTFSIKDSVPKQIIKGLIALISMPRNIHLVKQRVKIADQMFQKFPRIPQLSQEDH